MKMQAYGERTLPFFVLCRRVSGGLNPSRVSITEQGAYSASFRETGSDAEAGRHSLR